VTGKPVDVKITDYQVVQGMMVSSAASICVRIEGRCSEDKGPRLGVVLGKGAASPVPPARVLGSAVSGKISSSSCLGAILVQ